MDEAIYREHRGALIRYATVLAGPSEAKAVVSSGIRRIYKSRRTLGDLDQPRTHLMRAVLNEVIDRSRRASTLPLGDRAIEPRDARPDVLAAVIDLPVHQRAAAYLTSWVGMTSDEAADALGCRPATVRRNLYIARKKLDEVVEVPDDLTTELRAALSNLERQAPAAPELRDIMAGGPVWLTWQRRSPWRRRFRVRSSPWPRRR